MGCRGLIVIKLKSGSFEMWETKNTCCLHSIAITINVYKTYKIQHHLNFGYKWFNSLAWIGVAELLEYFWSEMRMSFLVPCRAPTPTFFQVTPFYYTLLTLRRINAILELVWKSISHNILQSQIIAIKSWLSTTSEIYVLINFDQVCKIS